MIPRISLFASAVRPKLFPAFLNSLMETTIPLEVVFAGNIWQDQIRKDGTTPHLLNVLKNNHITFRYVPTKNIKPAQCYEIARRYCTGELIHWTADDCEYTKDFLSYAYDYWRFLDDKKVVLSLQTEENYGTHVLTDMKQHSFFGYDPKTPLMAPLGLMSREYLEELGGYDRRYVCGQAENDIVMRVYADGGDCMIYGDKDNYIEIDHIKKHGPNHHGRPFAKGYATDRKVLESSWTSDNKVVMKRTDSFHPFEDKDILSKSQSNNLDIWE